MMNDDPWYIRHLGLLILLELLIGMAVIYWRNGW